MTLERLLPDRGPGRVLATATFAASVGFGLYSAGIAVYFTRTVGLSAAQLGAGLSVAGLVGILVSVPAGHLADRVGARETSIALALALAAALFATAWARSFPAFVGAVSVVGAAEAAGLVSRGALISHTMGSESRVRLSAYLRSVFNAGFTIGILGAGVALAVDTRLAYVALLWGNAASALAVALLYLRLPRVPATAREAGAPVWTALRDVPYAVVAQVSGVLVVADKILALALPLWVVRHTDAPRALAAWLLALNTVLVVTLQVRATRGASDVAGAARLQRRGYVAVAAACVVLAGTGGLGAWPAAVVLAAAVALLSLGEMWAAAAGWTLRFELAPDRAQGQYGGAFALGTAVPAVAGPTLVTTATDGLGVAGWLLLSALFVAAAAAGRPALGWAERTRASPPQTVPAR